MSEARENAVKMMQAAAAVKGLLVELGEAGRNDLLIKIGEDYEKRSGEISDANQADRDRAQKNNLAPSLLNRLRMPPPGASIKLFGDTAKAPAVIGSTYFDHTDKTFSFPYLKHERKFSQVRCERVPLGVVGIIYESRPSATAIAIAMCIKTGNSLVLKGGKDALNSNRIMVDITRETLKKVVGTADVCDLLIDDAQYSATHALVEREDLMDMVVVRGGAETIGDLKHRARVPVIVTGDGVVHAYVHDSDKMETAIKDIVFSKLGGASFCSCVETVLVNATLAAQFFKPFVEACSHHGIELVGCEQSVALNQSIKPIDQDGWSVEHLGMKLSVRVVKGFAEAVAHIKTYSTKHTEAIFTSDRNIAAKFYDAIDAGCIMVNSPTIFNGALLFGEGYPYHFGISTDKLHARGILTLDALTTNKYRAEIY